MEKNIHGTAAGNIKVRLKVCLFAGLWLAAVLWVALDALVGISVLRTPPEILTVPDLRGCRFTDGRLVDTAQFRTSVTYVYDGAPPRTVLAQSPPPGARRKHIPGGEPCPLSLVVSLGPREVVLPDVRGMDAREARSLLINRGLAVQVLPVAVTQGGRCPLPTHTVWDMMPSPGATVGDAARVTLYVTEPPAPTASGLGRADEQGVPEGETLNQPWPNGQTGVARGRSPLA